MLVFNTASFFEPANHKGRCLSIALTQPGRQVGMEYPSLPYLMPTSQMLQLYKKGKCPPQVYAAMYRNLLAARGITLDVLTRALQDQYPRTDVTFLCWEKEGSFCHRQVLYDWLKGQGAAMGDRK